MSEGLFEQFISYDNFRIALARVVSKKAKGGIDGVRVEDFQKREAQHLQSLITQIKSGTYLPKPVKAASIPKFNDKNEWRELGLPSISDKIVQAALLQVVEPLAEKIFLDTSYGYRPGKGHYRALRRVEHYLGNGKCSWVANRDIDNCFDSFNHELLINRFSELVHHDDRLVNLVALWLRMGIVDRQGHWRNVEAGVRQGQIMSPLLANLYLHPLDVFAAARGWAWVRYADNYLILTKSNADAKTADETVMDFLEKELSLKVNLDDNAIASLDNGFNFLVVHFQGTARSIAPDKIDKIRKKIQWHLAEKNMSSMEDVLQRLELMVQGWVRFYAFLNPVEEFSRLDNLIETSFENLARVRLSQGRWDRTLQDGLFLPKLTGYRDVHSGRKALEALWSRAIAHIESKENRTNRIQTADKNVSRQRRRYKREGVVSGELFVVSPGFFIAKQGGRIQVRQERRIVGEALVTNLRCITLGMHGVSLSSDVILLCVEKGIPVHFVNRFGNVTAVVSGPAGFSSETAVLQIQKKDLPPGLELARAFVYGKLKNQFSLLKYYGKYRRNNGNAFARHLVDRFSYLDDLVHKAKIYPSGDDPSLYRQQLMGIEGRFGAEYWQLFKHLLKNGVDFQGRERRGAKDLVNSLLNYGYAILGGRILNAVTKSGLNPTCSFLHAYQSGKPTLVYDLMEEFRANVVDRTVFSLLNRGISFSLDSEGLLDKPTKERFTRAVLSRLGAEVIFGGKQMTIEETISKQAENVRLHLEGKRRYHPYLSRW